MNFKDIASRLTGFSIPLFGVSWIPPETERSIARRIITALEDKRVLYNPTQLEMPEHCIHSVIEIRCFLSNELSGVSEDSSLSTHIRAMRGACRKFMNTLGEDDDISRFGMHRGHWASWVFLSAIGELRGVFGLHVGAIAAAYGIDLEEDLASILPVPDDTNDN